MRKIIIAIDGFSSTGKSTLAKSLAKELGYVYVDTGAMYRTVTLFAMRQGFLEHGVLDQNSLIGQLNQIHLSFKFNPELGFAEVYLNGENVEREIRQMEVSSNVSVVAAVSQVRRKLVEAQQQMGVEKGVVMDGRDIGTVVFPNAELKIFMTASAETRAQRRFDELKDKGEDVSFAEVLNNVEQRDALDSSRKDSPLVQADDAILYDNSKKTREDQFQDILALAKSKIS
ncbi:(d)CMP kinase [Flavobacteriaceae bacterium]|nr:(d)CMP kinase [Flavobacteriaceae bacterium]